MSFVGVMMVFTHNEDLPFGFDAVFASFLRFGLSVSTVKLFPGSLLPRLRNVGCVFGQIFPLLLLFVNDFLVVRHVSWIGHDSG